MVTDLGGSSDGRWRGLVADVALVVLRRGWRHLELVSCRTQFARTQESVVCFVVDSSARRQGSRRAAY